MAVNLERELIARDKEIERLQVLHLERTKLTHKALQEVERLTTRNELLEAGIRKIQSQYWLRSELKKITSDLLDSVSDSHDTVNDRNQYANPDEPDQKS